MSPTTLWATPIPGERVAGLGFPATPYTAGPKVPVLAVQLAELEAGDALWVHGECVVNWRGFGGGRGVFVASQLRITPDLPPLDAVTMTGWPCSPANGTNVSAAVPYGLVARTGALTLPVGVAPDAWAVLYVWVSSEAATAGDSLPVVPGYGQLHAMRGAA